MSKILFSHSYYYPLDKKQWANNTPYPPLGTIYAAAYLRQQGHTVDLFDTNLRTDPLQIEFPLRQERPDFLVLYDDCFNYLTKMCLTTMREAALQMIGIGKEHGCVVIVNSSDSTDHYDKYLDAGADYIIGGEGEETLSELIQSLETDRPVDEIKGIFRRANGQTIVHPKRPVLKDLDKLPLPAWDLIDIEAYKAIWAKGSKPFTLNMVTTRGCPFKCNWCAKPIYGNRYNTHSPAYVVRHLKHIEAQFGVTNFWMCDDIFGLKPGWVQDFNIALQEADLQISYYIQSRVDLLLKDDTIDALSQSGLKEVWVGAESGSQKILDAMDKGTSVEQIYKATHLLKKKNIRVAFFIQFGYLGETRDDIDKTIQMVEDLVPDDIGVSVSYPLPGTKFYEMVKDDLKLKANWTDSDDLAMMFQGTYHSQFYKRLHRYMHKVFRKRQALNNIRQLVQKPWTADAGKMRSALSLGYYWPSATLDRLKLEQMEHGNG